MRFLLFILFSLFVYSADLNTTIINGNEKVYNQLLAKIKKSKIKTDETILQETLLYKLINITKSHTLRPFRVQEPKNEKEYRQLASKIFDWIETNEQLQNSLENLQEKLEAIKDQINSSDRNSTSLLTMQLQAAFYTKAKTLMQKRQALYEKAIQQGKQLLVQALQKSLHLDINSSQKNIQQIEQSLAKNQKKIQKLEVEKERLELLGKKERVKTIQNAIATLQKKQKKLLRQKLLELFLQWSSALEKKESKKVFTLHHKIVKLAQSIYPENVIQEFISLLSSMEKSLLGQAEVIKGATMEQLRLVLDRLWQEINKPLFSINQTPISSFKLGLAILILLLGFLIGILYKKGINKLSESSHTITPSTKTLLANLGYYLILLIAFFVTLKTLGIDLSSIALIAGALSVGIGFGLQNMVSNFVSGLILMFERSIKIGDYVEIDDNLTGRISDIRMRSTTITTNDNIDVIVPNQDLIQNRVINWTMNDNIRRFRVPFGVAYGTDAKKVIQVVKEAVANSGYGDIYQDSKRKTRVIMTGMGDSSVNFELFVWIKGSEILYPKRTISRFLILIYEALNENGIEIPFPQRDLHIRSIDKTIPIIIQKDENGSDYNASTA